MGVYAVGENETRLKWIQPPLIVNEIETKIVIADLTELVLPKTCQTDFPDPDDTLNFKLIISPDEVRKTFQLRSLVI